VLRAGGNVTLADLENYSSSFKDAVNITLRNGAYTIYNPPPPSSGVVLDFILAILDGIAIHLGQLGSMSVCLFVTQKGSLYSIAERRVPELMPVLGSQPVGDVSHKPGGGLPLLSARPAVTLATLKRAATSFAAW